MNKEDFLKEILTKVLNSPVAYYRIFAQMTESVTAAVMLSQIFYWSRKSSVVKRNGWFYKSAGDWEDDTGLTRRQQETSRRILRDKGFLEEKLKGVPATLYFRLRNHFYKTLSQFPQIPQKRETEKKTMHKSDQQDSTKAHSKIPQKRKTISEITRDYQRLHSPAAPEGLIDPSLFRDDQISDLAKQINNRFVQFTEGKGFHLFEDGSGRMRGGASRHPSNPSKTGWSLKTKNSWTKVCQDLINTIGSERVEKVFGWYLKYYDDPYTPQARSMSTFQKKFLDIEQAIKRQKQQRNGNHPNEDSESNSTTSSFTEITKNLDGTTTEVITRGGKVRTTISRKGKIISQTIEEENTSE